MFETILVLPASFWVAAAILIAGMVLAVKQIPAGIGLPMLAVLGTVGAWYLGDALYNDYAENYAKTFMPDTLVNAWWQVAWFLVVFLVGCQMLHPMLNRGYLGQSSRVRNILRVGAGESRFQTALNQLFWACLSGWVVLGILAFLKIKSQILYFYFPFLAYRAEPWDRGQLGGGIDALISLASNVQIFIAAVFGVVMAGSLTPRIMRLAMLGCLTSWPYYIFDRTRNSMLAVLVPAVLTWVFLRMRGGVAQKVITLAIVFLAFHLWFGFIISNRSHMSVVQAMHDSESSGFVDSAKSHHEGLNMYEELCWINTFLDNGSYQPNFGQRYFAEIANVVPRSLWPGKPMIGIDYAIVRGVGAQAGSSDASNAGVVATISTGMIGQGVVNFGSVGGPAAAALLMSLWVCWLARLDLREQEFGRIPLFMLGLILTFNMGRDITLLVLYPFVFGSLIIWWLKRRQPPAANFRSRQKSTGFSGPESAEPVGVPLAQAGEIPDVRLSKY